MSQHRRSTLYCEMCGSPIVGKAHIVQIEGSEMVVCEKCYRSIAERIPKPRVESIFKIRTPQSREPKPLQKPSTSPKSTTTPPPRSSPSKPQPVTARGKPGGLGSVERYEIVEDYARRVREARTRLGLTQKDLALRVKVSENVIKRIESGALVPSIDLGRRLERVLGIKLVEPVAEEYEEASGKSENYYLTLGDIVELRED